MKFNIYLLSAGIAFIFLINSCSKDAISYRDYLEGKERIYPGVPKQIDAAPGNKRVQLSWRPSPDPGVTKYKIFWNNGADSVEFASEDHNTSGTITKVIDKLVEYSYSFTIYSYDQNNNRSVPVFVNNVKVYGDSYRASLTNRFLNVTTPYSLSDDGITLFFDEPDTINTGTEVKYTLNNNTVKSMTIKSTESSIFLADYKPGSKIYYQSAYKPVSTAIDTFYTLSYDSLTNVIIPVDKSLFAEVHLLNDVGTYDSGTSIRKIWDGNKTPTGYPNIFHSDNKQLLPHHFTFDMGKIYTGLAQFEIIGRDCCNNPTKFEIWGISSLAGAETQSPSNSAGWSQESVSKGWTLLKTVTRVDDGKAPFKVSFDENTTPVKYIRIRVLEVASGDKYFSNISEVSFWYK
ncbi:DUF4998 domain-containing protein [Pedobacter nyackensis]|uniref:DUF4998 domain-containing protein n=1 Tax=Pedobacter nyackensis TaxID=475255 RepID=UPI002930323D|nr:DUF4998 domain-containing protein [Pedobacter nyackensis]